MVDLVKRLQEFLKHKRLGVTELADMLGYNSPQKLYRLFNTENAWPSCQIIQDINRVFPQLNINWLFSGLGPMILTEKEINTDFKEKYYNCLEEKSWMAKKYLEEQEKHEKLLVRFNSLKDRGIKSV